MKLPPSLLLPALLAAWAFPAPAQDVGRVAPASLPLPLPGTMPMPPDQLRARNPWNLTMTGTWRFQLTHGQIKGGQFQPPSVTIKGITASSSEGKHPSQDAFDGSNDTRWTAQNGSFPQWLQADLGETRRVSGVTLAWEFPDDRYQCRVEGQVEGGPWQTLADATAAPGIGNGPVAALRPADVRYVRVFVTNAAHWASLREFQIFITNNGQETAWHPAEQKPAEGSPTATDTFAAPGFDDSRWDNQPVPSNWEMAGYSLPTYDDVDDTVGLYRRALTVPAEWAGKRVYWHFDGALDGAEVFVNGQRAGYHESGYTAFDVDLTGLVKPGQSNLFAVRVSKTTPSDDCETGDYQCMGGIYRDTSLIAVPDTRIDDLTVRTPLAANHQDATLMTRVHVAGKPGQTVAVAGELFSADGRPVAGVNLAGSTRLGADGTADLALSAPVQSPALWSAEKPNLYYVVFSLTGGGQTLERVEQRFGFRQIEIRDNVVLWNGVPIKCTGTCRHDFWADRGFALTEANWAEDVRLMKAANVNAVRTSHYNHAQRFLELCEEKGLYILDEVPYCWIGDQVKDPAYEPYLLQRARETLARDKNRPCVLAWSIGNENPYGIDSQNVSDAIRAADPTRPTFVSEMNPDKIKGQSWEDGHYPDPDAVDRAARNPKFGANFSEHPHIIYAREVQAYDPGASDVWSEALIKTWDKLWKDPTILGAFIWEWQNQGIADKNADTTTDFWYGPDHLRQENNKGIVDAYRHPKPEWWIVKSVYSPVAAGTRTVAPSGGTCAVPLTNHYSFTDLAELACRWTALNGTAALQTGTVNIACAPMQSVRAAFPAPAGMTALRLDFTRRDGTSVIAFNLAVEGVPLPAAPPALASGGALTTQDGPDTLVVRNARQQWTFDKRDGTVRSWRVADHDTLVGGPVLNLGESRAKNKDGDDKKIFRTDGPPRLDDARLTATPGTGGAVQVVVTGSVRVPKDGPVLGTLTVTYDLRPEAEMRVNWALDWTGEDANLWEEGLKFTVPAALARMNWRRDAFFTDYPAGHLGEPAGSARSEDVSFRASKRGLRWLTLTDERGVGLALLPTDVPLVGRAHAGADGTVLFASRELAADYTFSHPWVKDHDIRAAKGKGLSGSFALRAIDAPTLIQR